MNQALHLLEMRADGGVDWELTGKAASHSSEASAGGRAMQLRVKAVYVKASRVARQSMT